MAILESSIQEMAPSPEIVRDSLTDTYRTLKLDSATIPSRVN
jgi:hypothetical protein